MRLPLRRRYLVSRSQIHLISYQLVYYVVFTLVLSLWLLGPLVQEMTVGDDSESRAEMARMLLYLHARIWPLAALMVTVSAVHSVFITHRVVGPMVRFRRAFADIAAGILDRRVVLRKRDYLDDEAGALNHMTTSLAERVGRLRTCQRKIEDELEELDHVAQAGDRGPIDLHVLRSRVAELAGELDGFRCGEDEPALPADIEEAASLLPDRAAAPTPVEERK